MASANSPAAGSSASQSAAEQEDNLPPFAALTTDEEREEKARKASPGTFHVVVNPDSFSHLPEYSYDGVESPSDPYSPLRRGSMTSGLGKGRPDNASAVAGSPDPNMAILSRFENSTRRAAMGKGKQASTSPILTTTSYPPALTSWNLADGVPDGMPHGLPDRMTDEFPHGLPQVISVGMDDYYPSQSLIHIAASGGQGSALLNHFRTKIWSQVMQIDVIRNDSMIQASGMDIFESEAELFPPVSVVPSKAHFSPYPVYFDDFLRDSDLGE